MGHTDSYNFTFEFEGGQQGLSMPCIPNNLIPMH